MTMTREKLITAFIIFVTMLILTACAPASPAQPDAPSYGGNLAENPADTPSNGSQQGVTVVITGAVGAEQSWSEDDLRAMDTVESQAANSQGEQDTYTGVPVNDLLAAAQPQTDATSIIFSDGEGNSAEFPLEQILNCADCILSFRSRGGFSLVIPGNDPGLPVKGVVKIEVQ